MLSLSAFTAATILLPSRFDNICTDGSARSAGRAENQWPIRLFNIWVSPWYQWILHAGNKIVTNLLLVNFSKLTDKLCCFICISNVNGFIYGLFYFKRFCIKVSIQSNNWLIINVWYFFYFSTVDCCLLQVLYVTNLFYFEDRIIKFT